MIASLTSSNAEHRVPRSLLLVALLVFAFLVLRIASVGSPIMGGDEYAYFATAKYAGNAAQIYQLDPAMQPVENKVYPVMYHAWAAVSDVQTAQVGRIFNALLYIFGAFLLFAIFARVFDRASALASAALYLLLPMSFYSLTLLPEVEFQVSVYLAALILVRAGQHPSIGSILLVAMASVLSYFVKPHALAMIAAIGMFLFATGVLDERKTRLAALALGLGRAAGYAVATGAMILAITKSFPATTVAGTGVVSSFYLPFVKMAFDAQFVIARLPGLLLYLGGHLWIFVIFFAPGLWALEAAVRRTLRRPEGESQPGLDAVTQRRGYFALFVALLLVAFVSMISVFTIAAGDSNAFESGRLHGRYLACILPFLLAFSVWGARHHPGRVAAFAGLVALVLFTGLPLVAYKLFPWDYPEAFGMFRPTATYWGFTGALSWPVYVILAASMAYAALRWLKVGGKWSYAAFALAWMLSSHAQMRAWLDYQASATRETIAAARAIDDYLGDVPVGSGFVATTDRYGEASYLLMGLDPLQHVRVFATGAKIAREDIPADVGWLVAPRSLSVDIPAAARLEFGNQQLVLLDARYGWPDIQPVPAWDGRDIAIDTGLSGPHAAMTGFNDPEVWGSWTKDENASIALPGKVSGRVSVKFFAWLLAAHPDSLLEVGLGGDSKVIRLTGDGADYQVELDPKTADDRLTLTSRVVKAPGDARGLGVAIARLRISALPREDGH